MYAPSLDPHPVLNGSCHVYAREMASLDSRIGHMCSQTNQIDGRAAKYWWNCSVHHKRVLTLPLSYHPPQAPDRHTTQLATATFMYFAVWPVHGIGDGAGALVTHVFEDSRLDRSIEHDGEDSRQPLLCITVLRVCDSSAHQGMAATAHTAPDPTLF